MFEGIRKEFKIRKTLVEMAGGLSSVIEYHKRRTWEMPRSPEQAYGFIADSHTTVAAHLAFARIDPEAAAIVAIQRAVEEAERLIAFDAEVFRYKRSFIDRQRRALLLDDVPREIFPEEVIPIIRHISTLRRTIAPDWHKET